MVQALVVVLEDGRALGFARSVFGGGVDNVACEDFLPEGEAAGGTWLSRSLLVHRSLSVNDSLARLLVGDLVVVLQGAWI